MSNGIILLVEDETFTAELTMACLRKAEGAAIEVVLAHDGVEAIDYLFNPELEASEMPAWYSWTSRCPGWTASRC